MHHIQLVTFSPKTSSPHTHTFLLCTLFTTALLHKAVLQSHINLYLCVSILLQLPFATLEQPCLSMHEFIFKSEYFRFLAVSDKAMAILFLPANLKDQIYSKPYQPVPSFPTYDVKLLIRKKKRGHHYNESDCLTY